VPQNYVLLETIVLGQNSASVTFDNIPQTGYTDLKIVGSARSTYSGGYVAMRLNPNGSTTNASSSIVYGSGTSVAAFADTIIYATINANTSISNTFGNFEIYCPNYTVSATKTFSVDAITEDNASTALSLLAGSRWESNSAITSLYLAPTVGDFMANSTFSLYGVADTGATPVISPFATGGNIVANDGTYWYHAFLSSGTFVPQKPLSCDYLLIAGGGAGGGQIGGGGGAGGLRYFAAQSLAQNTSYPAIIGAGGAGISGVPTESGNGGNSSFAGNSATGGGGGGGNGGDFKAGKTGGSGGGAGEDGTGSAGNAGGYTPVEGFAGGGANNNPNYGSGGGGGAGAVGATGTTSAGGNGGAGVNTYSAFATATNTGVSGFYAGGGGGSIIQASGNGSGGAGGGGRGGCFEDIVQPQSGTAGTGSGGGGQASNSASFKSGSGGSGILIVRYPMAS
jgi:hypothetical protein